MKELKVAEGMQIGTVRQNFLETFGVGIRFYNGKKFADDDAAIVYVGKKNSDKYAQSELSFGADALIKNVQKIFEDVFGVKIQIEDKDGKLANETITLLEAGG